MFATISADIVSSTSLSVDETIGLRQRIESLFALLKDKYPDFNGRLIKGDYIECVMQDVSSIFRVALVIKSCIKSFVSIRQTTGLKLLYTTIATVTMNLIVAVAIVLLNLYVTACISYQIHSFVLSVHIPDVSTSICVEVDSITVHGQPFYNKAFVQ